MVLFLTTTTVVDLFFDPQGCNQIRLKKKQMPIMKAEYDHERIIPKPQAMKRISHMGLPRNASHLIQGLSHLSPNSLLIRLCFKKIASLQLSTPLSTSLSHLYITLGPMHAHPPPALWKL
jgi:hypothetical protein